MMKRQRNRKGQSTLEYIIIWTAIIAAIIMAMEGFKGKINTIIDNAGTKIEQETDKLLNSGD